MISIGIIEDDAEVREGICLYLGRQPEFVCPREAGSVEEFMDGLTPRRAPDLVLMDIGLPGMSGIEGVKLLKEKMPRTEVMMLTVHEDPDKIFQALQAGAIGYLLKSTSFPEMRKAILAICKGGSIMSPTVSRKVVRYFNESKGKFTQLSDQQRLIVNCLVEGLSYRHTAEKLHMGIDAVRYHLKNIYKKLHVNSKVQIISKAYRGEL